MNRHQVLTGAVNSGDSGYSVGSVEGIHFTVSTFPHMEWKEEAFHIQSSSIIIIRLLYVVCYIHTYIDEWIWQVLLPFHHV